MLQGMIAGWIFILFMAALFVDKNLRHTIPAIFGVFLSLIVVTVPIWVPIILDNMPKNRKSKKQVVEIKVVK